MTYNWYTVNVIAGQEQIVCNEINNMVQKLGDKINIKEAFVPTEEVVRFRNGKKVNDKVKLFPSYVFVYMEMNSETNSLIRGISKVMNFLGSEKKPRIVSEAEMSRITQNVENAEKKLTEEAVFSVGENVKIISGPFESFSGVVEEVEHDKQRLKISVSIFGRPTSVNLDVSQVEKLD